MNKSNFKVSEFNTDHLGVKYKNFGEMCKAYHRDRSTVKQRLCRGWTLKDALTCDNETSASKTYACEDHLGTKFKSKREMCKHYGVDFYTYNARRKKGWSVERALTTPVSDKWTDHLGNKYPSKKALCKAYGISVAAYNARLEHGWPLEKALTFPARASRTGEFVYDHLGNEFYSVEDMCRCYGVTSDCYKRRLRQGMTIEEALTTPVYRQVSEFVVEGPIIYNGQEFSSLTKLAKTIKISQTSLRHALSLGLTLEDAIDKIQNHIRICRVVEDHLHNTFPSYQAMCDFYGVSIWHFNNRRKKGYSIERCLTEPVRAKSSLIGRTIRQRNGLLCTALSYINHNQINVVWEDGEYGVTSKTQFKRSLAAHPKLKYKGRCIWQGCDVHSLAEHNGETYYECECNICGYKDVITSQQIMQHYQQHQK